MLLSKFPQRQSKAGNAKRLRRYQIFNEAQPPKAHTLIFCDGKHDRFYTRKLTQKSLGEDLVQFLFVDEKKTFSQKPEFVLAEFVGGDFSDPLTFLAERGLLSQNSKLLLFCDKSVNASDWGFPLHRVSSLLGENCFSQKDRNRLENEKNI